MTEVGDDDPIPLRTACALNAARRSGTRQTGDFQNRQTRLYYRFRNPGDVPPMPRRRLPPRLYLDPERKQWIIRDGARGIRTSCIESDRSRAEKRLAEYLTAKHTPKRSDTPLIADILVVYAREHVPTVKTARNIGYNIGNLSAWWGGRGLSDVTARNCRAYAATKTSQATGADLEILRAAINYWHREHGPLPAVPVVVMPPKAEPRERWLTRSEAARLLWSARRTPYLARFILLGLYTGSRPNVLCSLRWSWLDFDNGVMLRRAPGTLEDSRKRTPKVRIGQRMAHLRRWRRLDDPRYTHICHNRGQPVRDISRSWSGALDKAGLDRTVIRHTLRHTRATWLMKEGVEPWKAAQHLGMSVNTLLATYGHHHPDFQREAAAV
jgi:integrase